MGTSFDFVNILEIASYLFEDKDYLELIKVSKKCEHILDDFKFNPIAITPQNQTLFPNIETQYLYSVDDVVLENISKYIVLFEISCEEIEKIKKPNMIFKHIVLLKEERLRLQDVNKIPENVNSLGDSCFENETIKSIHLPDSLTSIGDFCFDSCTSLSTLVLPSKVTIIPEGLCCNCVSLKEVIIPNETNTIYSQAFFNCECLSSLSLPDSITTIGERAFCDCSKLSFVNLPTTLSYIGEQSFQKCLSLQEVNIPSGCVFIGKKAFRNCFNLTKVIIGSSVEMISEQAFENCDLKEIDLSQMNGFCGTNCFSGNTNITKILLKENSFRNYFEECTLNDYVFFCGKNETKIDSIICTKDNINSKGREEKDFNIDCRCNSLGKNAFEEIADLHSFYVPCYIETILGSAFKNCSKLTSIYLSPSVVEIHSKAFKNCVNLRCIELSPNIISIGKRSFAHCTNLEEIVLPTTTKKIGKMAFYNCSKMSKIVIPSNIPFIGIDSFGECNKLKIFEMKMENGNYPFETSYSEYKIFKKLEITSNKVVFTNNDSSISNSIPNDICSVLGNRAFCGSDLTSLEVPSNITEIRKECFKWCDELQSIVIPTTVSIFGDHVFGECESITSIEYGNNKIYPGIVNYWDSCIENQGFECPNKEFTNFERKLFFNQIPQNVVSIGNGCFCTCGELTSITIPSTVTSLKKGSFSVMKNLKKIEIPSTVNSIEKLAFSACCDLTSVQLPSNLEYIKDAMFCLSKNISFLQLPHSVTKIGEMVFSGCFSLEEIVLPSCLQCIGNNAFSQCSSLTRIDLPTKMSSIGFGCFRSCYNLKEINLGLLTEIPTSCFAGCVNLSTILLPNSITSIGSSAFKGCEKLKEIIIPNNIKKIGYCAFLDCDSLEIIDIHSDIQIDNTSFQHCQHLKMVKMNKKEIQSIDIPIDYITAQTLEKNGVKCCCQVLNRYRNELIDISSIPKSVSILGECYYRNCDYSEITIPSNITKIEKQCFANSKNLIKINYSGYVNISSDAFLNCLKMKKTQEMCVIC